MTVKVNAVNATFSTTDSDRRETSLKSMCVPAFWSGPLGRAVCPWWFRKTVKADIWKTEWKAQGVRTQITELWYTGDRLKQ